MANSEDVLERAENHNGLRYSPSGDIEEAEALVRALAAELRELRRDRKRLDWMFAHWATVKDDEIGARWHVYDRDTLDAAMGAELGEGETR